jgi:transcriptional regulator GlxA family with amidase domain
MRVDILALDGVLDSALGISRDVLGAANRLVVRAQADDGAEARPPFEVRLVATHAPLRTGTGLSITPERLLGRSRERARRDVLVILGMNVPLASELDAAIERPDVRAAIAVVKREAERGTWVLASCSGTFLCAEAGLLDGRECATSWWLGAHFRKRYPRALLREDAMVVPVSGPVPGARVVTAGAALSQVDLMLWLVRRVCGPQVARLCARYLVLDERPSQGRYLLVDHLQHDSEEVRRAEAYARRTLHQGVSVEDLARAARTSVRTLERRFEEAVGMSPMRYLQRLRVERAIHLLETTRASIDEVAARVGYSDTVSLRRILRREASITAKQAVVASLMALLRGGKEDP